jgi:hypothetical protein
MIDTCVVMRACSHDTVLHHGAGFSDRDNAKPIAMQLKEMRPTGYTVRYATPHLPRTASSCTQAVGGTVYGSGNCLQKSPFTGHGCKQRQLATAHATHQTGTAVAALLAACYNRVMLPNSTALLLLLLMIACSDLQ